MKRIVYLTFYFKPDLCAGSFRNSPLSVELANQAKGKNVVIDVYTTLPNRYSSFDVDALEFEQIENLRIHRISLPPHKSGILDQVLSFWKFYSEVKRLNKNKKADLVFASSSRLFTAYLGYNLAKQFDTKLYLDIRDIFVDTMNDVFKSTITKMLIMPILKFVESRTFNYAIHINLISGGFREYFTKYRKVKFSTFSNGIDEEFLSNSSISQIKQPTRKLIVYAGNIGEGQGLHKIIPKAAELLGENFHFLIVGDGGTKKHLQEEIKKFDIHNVTIKNPVNRNDLQLIYKDADYLFLHLNDYPAFRKVLPSKIFELATFNKPILAGVSGYSAEFINNEVSDSFVFEPCNVNQLVNYLSNVSLSTPINRIEFINNFKRSKINESMAKSILNYI